MLRVEDLNAFFLLLYLWQVHYFLLFNRITGSLFLLIFVIFSRLMLRHILFGCVHYFAYLFELLNKKKVTFSAYLLRNAYFAANI